jgi:flagellar hook protein FlgE
MTAFQQMIDVAGNNLANINTTAFKGSSMNFAACMSQTLKQASGPTDSMGGTNATQVGSGVSVGSITANMTGGSIVGTNNNLDVAIDGEGYFVVSSGEETLYTRAGAFGVDEQGYMTDPSTGYRVQRIGTTGESDGFQVTGNTNIRIPYDVSLPASGTTEIMFSGNCSASAAGSNLAQTLVSNVTYTTDGGSDATAATQIDQLDQFNGGSAADGQLGAAQTGTITISGYNPDGSALSAGLSFTVGAGTTVGDLITHLNTNVLTGSTASFVDGQIVIRPMTATRISAICLSAFRLDKIRKNTRFFTKPNHTFGK